MLGVVLNKGQNETIRVLCLGAHSDDIEIGCGGTILRLLAEYSNLDITWIVFGAREIRASEAYSSAEKFLQNVKQKKIIVKDFQDGFFPYIGGEIKYYFENLKYELSPDLIFTHYRGDLHQDHRLINELTWNTFRDHLILEYEIPKYDGGLGSPNLFIHLDESTYRTKIINILNHFKSQRSRRWFTEETFLAIMRLRGIESNAVDKYAEAFYAPKLVLHYERSAK
jgi:LmbE family N-acetylglucosaminyl deacetylase